MSKWCLVSKYSINGWSALTLNLIGTIYLNSNIKNSKWNGPLQSIHKFLVNKEECLIYKEGSTDNEDYIDGKVY